VLNRDRIFQKKRKQGEKGPETGENGVRDGGKKIKGLKPSGDAKVYAGGGRSSATEDQKARGDFKTSKCSKNWVDTE